MGIESGPVVLNVWGGPGIGKTTLTSRIFTWLKINTDFKVEYSHEFSKSLVYDGRTEILKQDQIFVFSNQYHRLQMVAPHVDVVVTDSPLPLTIVYNETVPEEIFNPMVMEAYNKYKNINILLKRTVPYEQYGRHQTFGDALLVDTKIKSVLKNFSECTEYDPCEDDIDNLMDDILNDINIINQNLISKD